MLFRPYPKIPLRPDSTPGGSWVAMEKIHGANFVIGICGKQTHFGKRKAWLKPEDAFFGWQLIAQRLESQLRQIAEMLNTPQLIAYGELFGGHYPHPDIPSVPGLSAVQTGIWYTPQLEWSLFDLHLAADDTDPGTWIDFPELLSLAENSGLRTPPILGRGKRSDLEMLPIEFQSKVPTQLGLPPLPDNLAEGWVLKPERGGATHPAFKKKIAAFSEARFGEAEAWEPGHVRQEDMLFWAETLVNPARIASARSKVGTQTAAILDEVVLDIAIDLELTFPQAWAALGDGQEAILDHVRHSAMTALQIRRAP